MQLLSLAEAWHWVQIGFCMAVGASIILGGLGAVFGASAAPTREPEDPHCSRCCPNPDDDFDDVP